MFSCLVFFTLSISELLRTLLKGLHRFTYLSSLVLGVVKVLPIYFYLDVDLCSVTSTPRILEFSFVSSMN